MKNPVRLALLQVWIPALLLCGTARADFVPCVTQTGQTSCDFQSFQVDIIIGTAQLFAPGGGLLSTATALTTDFSLWPDIATQLAGDPLPWSDGVPTYIQDHLADIIGNTDLGIFTSPQGVISIGDADHF